MEKVLNMNAITIQRPGSKMRIEECIEPHRTSYAVYVGPDIALESMDMSFFTAADLRALAAGINALLEE